MRRCAALATTRYAPTAVCCATVTMPLYGKLADLYGRLGKPDSRIVQLEALASLDPGPRRQVALGLAYVRGGEFDHAISTELPLSLSS